MLLNPRPTTPAWLATGLALAQLGCQGQPELASTDRLSGIPEPPPAVMTPEPEARPESTLPTADAMTNLPGARAVVEPSQANHSATDLLDDWGWRVHDFESLAERFEARPDWFVRVVGDSLSKVGFRSGDILAVRRNPDPRDGDIVVARIGDEVVVKRFCRRDENTVELQPESHNPEHEVIPITPHTVGFEVVGTVVGAVVGTRRESAE